MKPHLCLPPTKQECFDVVKTETGIVTNYEIRFKAVATHLVEFISRIKQPGSHTKHSVQLSTKYSKGKMAGFVNSGSAYLLKRV